MLHKNVHIAATRHQENRRFILSFVFVILIFIFGIFLYISNEPLSPQLSSTEANSIPSIDIASQSAEPIGRSTDNTSLRGNYEDEDANSLISDITKLRRQYDTFLSKVVVHPNFRSAAESISQKLLTIESNSRDATKYLENTAVFREIQSELSSLETSYNELIELLLSEINRYALNLNYDSFEITLRNLDQLNLDDERIAAWLQFTGASKHYFDNMLISRNARNENNIQAELQALRNASVSLPPNISHTNRIIDLERLIQAAELNLLIKTASENISMELFNEALVLIKEVLSIDPSNQSAKELLLIAQENKALKDLRLIISDAETAVTADNWPSARLLFEQAIEISPNNTVAIEGLELSLQVINFIDGIINLTANPIRLTDSNIREYALNLIDDIEGLSITSEILDEQVESLRIVLNTDLNPRSVTIISDGEARIEVRGVGYIEPTRERNIELRPGEYELNAACDGHINKIYYLVVPISDQNIKMEVTCGEKL